MRAKKITIILAVVLAACLLAFLVPNLKKSTAPTITETSQPTPKDLVECDKVTSEVKITMDKDKFSPDPVNIKVCTKVTFENVGSEDHWPASNIHPTHDIFPEFDPKGGIAPGKSWSFTFNRLGTWKYHDHLVPYNTGTITVTQN